MNRKYLLRSLMLSLLVLTALTARADRGWRLVWQENFRGRTMNTSEWEKIGRGRVPWNKYMSPADSLYALRRGRMVLRGVRNGHLAGDTARYLTGGIRTRRTFTLGKIEIRARLGETRGAWPAFWLLPDGKWPDGGEIDIMEHLNSDSIAYQTVHSYYTYVLRHYDTPPQSATGVIRRGRFNTYAVEMYRDSLVFRINDRRTFAYPRLPGRESEKQFVFDRNAYHLLLDMQIGGPWVGKATPGDYPVEMEIDWVRYYRQRK